jgi:hypothetical protein
VAPVPASPAAAEELAPPPTRQASIAELGRRPGSLRDASSSAADPASSTAPVASTSAQASDLWRLVTEPDAGPSMAAAAEAAPRRSRMTTVFLMVLVALVIVALVAGFLVMFTNLL